MYPSEISWHSLTIKQLNRRGGNEEIKLTCWILTKLDEINPIWLLSSVRLIHHRGDSNKREYSQSLDQMWSECFNVEIRCVSTQHSAFMGFQPARAPWSWWWWCWWVEPYGTARAHCNALYSTYNNNNNYKIALLPDKRALHSFVDNICQKSVLSGHKTDELVR